MKEKCPTGRKQPKELPKRELLTRTSGRTAARTWLPVPSYGHQKQEKNREESYERAAEPRQSLARKKRGRGKGNCSLAEGGIYGRGWSNK